jgi:hypothetical protein
MVIPTQLPGVPLALPWSVLFACSPVALFTALPLPYP